MNIVKRELRANLKSLLVWCSISGLFVVMGFTEFKAYYGEDAILEVMERMPSALLDAFSMQAFNLTTVIGFYGVMYSYFALLLSISAVLWGSDIISKEERDKTVEFTLTMPVTRGKVLISKTIVVAINSVVLLGTTWLAVLGITKKFQPEAEFYEFLAVSMLGLLIMQMIYMSLGVFLGAVLKKPNQSGSVATSLVIGTYFISLIHAISSDLDFLKYLSPIAYFNPANILHELSLDARFLWLSAAIIGGALVGGYIAYSRRDMQI